MADAVVAVSADDVADPLGWALLEQPGGGSRPGCAIDQFRQVIDVLVSPQRDATAAHRFFQRAIDMAKVTPAEVITDQAPVYPAVLEDLLPAAWHRTDQYANNRVECDHGRLKARLRPMRSRKQDRSARVIVAGHALVQNLRRGHYELAVEEPTNRRVAASRSTPSRRVVPSPSSLTYHTS
jgi:IS6 family transposase